MWNWGPLCVVCEAVFVALCVAICVAVCCSVLQCVAACCSKLQFFAVHCSALHFIAAHCSACSALLCSAVHFRALQCNGNAVQCIAVRYSVCAVRCSMLQCVAACYRCWGRPPLSVVQFCFCCCRQRGRMVEGWRRDTLGCVSHFSAKVLFEKALEITARGRKQKVWRKREQISEVKKKNSKKRV